MTVQLVSGVASPTPASNQIVLRCASPAPVATAKIAPLTQPAARVRVVGVRHRDDEHVRLRRHDHARRDATCTNAAGGAAQVTIVAA